MRQPYVVKVVEGVLQLLPLKMIEYGVHCSSKIGTPVHSGKKRNHKRKVVSNEEFNGEEV